MELRTPLVLTTLFFCIFSRTCSPKLLNHGSARAGLPVYPVPPRSAFVGLNRKKTQEPSTPSTPKRCSVDKNAVLSKIVNSRYSKLVLVASGTVAFSVTVYKLARRLLHYLLVARYARKDAPGVAKTIGPVLLRTSPRPPNKTFLAKVVNPVSKALQKLPYFRGLTNPGMVRVPTWSVVDKDTLVCLVFYNSMAFKRIPELREQLNQMVRWSQNLKGGGKKVVFVAVDYTFDRDYSYDVLKSLDCYSVPSDPARLGTLARSFPYFVFPYALVLDSEGHVLNENYLDFRNLDASRFPWADLRVHDLLPKYLFTTSKEPVPKAALEGTYLAFYYDHPNPELDELCKRRMVKLYQMLHEATGGKFKIVNLSQNGAEFAGSTELAPGWLTVAPEDTNYVTPLYKYLGLSSNSWFSLVDKSGRVFSSNPNLLDPRGFEALVREYLKGPDRVDTDLRFTYRFERPQLLVFANSNEPAELERLESEMNRALASHKQRRFGPRFTFTLVKDPEEAARLKKVLKLGKEQMVVINFDRQVVSKSEVNEKSILDLIDLYSATFRY